MDKAQALPDGTITMTPAELGRVVGAAVGAAVSEQQRVLAEEVVQLRTDMVGQLDNLRLRLGTLTEAIGGLERHNAERQQQLWKCLVQVSERLGQVEQSTQRLGQAAGEGELGSEGEQVAGDEDLPRRGLRRGVVFGGERLVMPVPPGSDDQGKDAERSAANLSMNAASRFKGAWPKMSMM